MTVNQLSNEQFANSDHSCFKSQSHSHIGLDPIRVFTDTCVVFQKQNSRKYFQFGAIYLDNFKLLKI
jgi:hypothetical protein